MIRLKITAALLPCLFLFAQMAHSQNQNVDWDPVLTEDWTPVDDSVSTTGYFGEPPSDAIILFDGTDLSQWEAAPGYFASMSGVPDYIREVQKHTGPAPWTVEDVVMTVVPGSGNIKTKQGFTDFQLHIEWKTPSEIDGDGQGRGNSGVFLQGLYEIQVLDSWQNPTYPNGQAGSIYKQTAPMVNASRPPGEWQSYDIYYYAPRFDDDGKLVRPAYVTVIHNGVLIHHNQKIEGPTCYIGLSHYEPHPKKMPVGLQDHGDYVSFRNIWIREL
jgi:hypothetical protein